MWVAADDEVVVDRKILRGRGYLAIEGLVIMRNQANERCKGDGLKIYTVSSFCLGKLVPEDVIFGLLTNRLVDGLNKGESGFILDGLPRNRYQAGILDEIADIDLVISFKCVDKFSDTSLMKPTSGGYIENEKLQQHSAQASYGLNKGGSGFILDGLPRNRYQAEILDEIADIDLVISFKCVDKFSFGWRCSEPNSIVLVPDGIRGRRIPSFRKLGSSPPLRDLRS